MSNYIPHYTKKQKILRRKEQELRRELKRGIDLQKLLGLAADVRDSRIRVLRAIQATIPPSEKSGEALTKFEEAIEAARLLPPEAILMEFGGVVEISTVIEVSAPNWPIAKACP